VIDAVPVTPPDVAVIVTLPGETPVTTPLEDTVATPASPVDHAIEAPVMTVPFASRAVAVRVVDQATLTVALDGDTVMLATGPGPAAVTVMIDDPV
jgi:hypothetical protein